MADEEQLEVLRQGVEVWNAWREQNPRLKPNLSFAKLSKAHLPVAEAFITFLAGVDFSGAYLCDAKLSGADLAGANLSGADLECADLAHATFSGADLSGTSLIAANLFNASLIDANLSGALLFGANLSGAHLSGANLKGAVLSDTVFGANNLSATKGLEACRHEGPSIIDHRTLRWSGQLPLSFLRGCGLPENLIEYLPSLLNQPIQFYSCFMSYSSKDDDFARRLHADLQDTGIRCWFAPEDMKIGDRHRTRIDEVIRLREKLLLVLSENSLSSDWVEKEVEAAFEKERETKSTVLFPIRLDDAVMTSRYGWAADIRRSRHIGDFGHWKDHDGYRKAFDRLLRDLKVDPET